jgi:hypothetical protein
MQCDEDEKQRMCVEFEEQDVVEIQHWAQGWMLGVCRIAAWQPSTRVTAPVGLMFIVIFWERMGTVPG